MEKHFNIILNDPVYIHPFMIKKSNVIKYSACIACPDGGN